MLDHPRTLLRLAAGGGAYATEIPVEAVDDAGGADGSRSRVALLAVLAAVAAAAVLRRRCDGPSIDPPF